MNIFSNVRRKSLQEYINEARGREGSIFSGCAYAGGISGRAC